MAKPLYKVKPGSRHDQCLFCDFDMSETAENSPTIDIKMKGVFSFRVCAGCVDRFSEETLIMLAEVVRLRRVISNHCRAPETRPRNPELPRLCSKPRNHRGKHRYAF